MIRRPFFVLLALLLPACGGAVLPAADDAGPLMCTYCSGPQQPVPGGVECLGVLKEAPCAPTGE